MPNLPIDSMSVDEFRQFKRKYLDSEKLSQKALEEISKLYSLGKPEAGELSCDEMHGHRYSCVDYNSPSSGIVERLKNEIDRLQKNEKSIISLIKSAT